MLRSLVGSEMCIRDSRQAMQELYCSSCRINIELEAEYKKHFKSEFHRYNIKRKLVNLTPATIEQYLQKKNQNLGEKEKQFLDQSAVFYEKCTICNKTFSTKKTYEQHLKSAKHKESLKKSTTNSKTSSVLGDVKPSSEALSESQSKEIQSTKSEIITAAQQPREVCLFCNKMSSNLNENLVHMRKVHSFFVLDRQYCSNIEGLLTFLAKKIFKEVKCIFCNNEGAKSFKSAEALQSHMISKGHCFMNNEHFFEYQEYYDYSTAAKTEEEQQKLKEIVENASEDSDYNDDEDEDEDEDEDNEVQEGKELSLIHI
eukprot:TRINITY_DN387_c0_g1_i9.p1 TRINITY_DN387_c0_g1~~TRINITY_DN387_c0_g1_i9.p1  ORF type:complete len:314 (+),score=69.49 TRINITY_DN387_c0_g1_i9:85-1026(+)